MSRNFDGIDDTINCGQGTSLNALVPGTFMCWIYVNNMPGVGLFSDVITKGYFAYPTGFLFPFYFQADATGSYLTSGWVQDNGLDNRSQSTDYGDIPTKKWTNIATTIPSNAAITIYRDGKPTADFSSGTSSTPPSVNNKDLALGHDAADTGIAFFDGILAYVQVWNRLLSQNEIIQAMNLPGSVRGSLVFFMPLWGAPIEGDYSGNKNNGILTGTTISSLNPPISSVFYIPKPRSEYAAAYTTAAAAVPVQDLDSFSFFWG